MNDANLSSSVKNFSRRSLVRFLLVGAGATLVHYLVMGFLYLVMALPAALSSSAGFVVSAVANYVLNRNFTFRSAQAHRTGVVRFSATAICGLALNYLFISVLLALHVHVLPAQIISTIGVIVWNYCIHGLWTFRTAKV